LNPLAAIWLTPPDSRPGVGGVSDPLTVFGKSDTISGKPGEGTERIKFLASGKFLFRNRSYHSWRPLVWASIRGSGAELRNATLPDAAATRRPVLRGRPPEQLAHAPVAGGDLLREPQSRQYTARGISCGSNPPDLPWRPQKADGIAAGFRSGPG
jgi:hypothetical protein